MENTHEFSTWQNVQRLIIYLKTYKKWLWLVWLMALIAGFMRLATPFLFQSLTDAVLSPESESLGGLVAITIFVIAIDIALRYSRKIVSVRYEALTIQNLRNEVVKHIQGLPISFIENFHSGDLISRLNNDIDKIAVIPKRIHELVEEPVVFILGFSYMYLLSWKLLLATCVLIPISAILFDIVMKPIQAHAHKEMTALAKANAVTQDAIRGILIIKAFNLQKLLSQKYQNIADDVRKEGLEIEKRSAIALVVFLMLRYTPQLVVPLYGGYLAFIGEITVGGLLASTYLISTFYIPVEMGLGWVRQLREIAPAVERVFTLLDHPIEDEPQHQIQPSLAKNGISFQLVNFQYSDDVKVLRDFDLRIEKGKMVALVGSSGCGKSTVLKLLCGFYQPQSGEVYIGDANIFQTSIREMRKQISYVTQEAYLFPTTIAENIEYGRLGASQEEIEAAAKAANAHDFILSQPAGYQTQVGEWGAKLSGGEKQRIALARAILKDAPILLLDEPTSALDLQSEALVQEALDHFMQGRTVLVVAHRLSTIKGADEIIVLEEGGIRERGTHAQLMGANALYKRLYQNQMEPEVPYV